MGTILTRQDTKPYEFCLVAPVDYSVMREDMTRKPRPLGSKYCELPHSLGSIVDLPSILCDSFLRCNQE